MRQRSQQRIMRVVLSALLKSDLTIEELQELSGDLNGGSFTNDLHSLLNNIIYHFKIRSHESPFGTDRDAQLKRAYAAVQRRRLSKPYVLDLMERASGEDFKMSSARKLSVQEILKEFFAIASTDQADNFMMLIDSPIASDPFLKGIANR
jgi:hypothetical protein